VPLTLSTAKAIVVYLRARQSHAHAQAQTSPTLWLGTRNRGPVTGAGRRRGNERRVTLA
jgi:hypothetical protein